MKAVVVMRTVSKVYDKPVIHSLGGFSAVTPDGRTYSFDWGRREGRIELIDGHAVITSYLSDWSSVYTESNDQNGVTAKEVTPEFIVKSQLEEINYECYMSYFDEQVGNWEPLELVRFMLEDNHGLYQIPNEEVDRYNKEQRERESEWM